MAGVLVAPTTAFVAGLVVLYVMLADMPPGSAIPQPVAALVPALMIVAKAVAAWPTATERLDGRTAATICARASVQPPIRGAARQKPKAQDRKRNMGRKRLEDAC